MFSMFLFNSPGTVTVTSNGRFSDTFLWKGNVCYPSESIKNIDIDVISEGTLYEFKYNNQVFYRVKINR